MLRALRERLDCDLHLRGNVLTLDGDSGDVEQAATIVDELVELIEQGHDVAPGTIEAVTGALDADESPAEILDDVVWRHRNTKVAPKTLNQKRYVDSIRRHTITFGIGPAGTGKTFLAVAMAAAALTERKVQRIILTRPAVEAGERLGFLPGRHPGQGRPLPAAALRRPLRHDRPRPRQRLLRARRDRGGAARLHARPGAASRLPCSRRPASGRSEACGWVIWSSARTASRPPFWGSIRRAEKRSFGCVRRTAHRLSAAANICGTSSRPVIVVVESPAASSRPERWSADSGQPTSTDSSCRF